MSLELNTIRPTSAEVDIASDKSSPESSTPGVAPRGPVMQSVKGTGSTDMTPRGSVGGPGALANFVRDARQAAAEQVSFASLMHMHSEAKIAVYDALDGLAAARATGDSRAIGAAGVALETARYERDKLAGQLKPYIERAVAAQAAPPAVKSNVPPGPYALRLSAGGRSPWRGRRGPRPSKRPSRR